MLCVVLMQCNKTEGTNNMSNQDIIMDIAQTALYYHTVFREAEYAWALVDMNNYKSFTEKVENVTDNSKYKEYAYDENENIVKITYNSWVTNKLNLFGEITVEITTDSYRNQTSNAVNVNLYDFFINGQEVIGGSQIKYTSVIREEERCEPCDDCDCCERCADCEIDEECEECEICDDCKCCEECKCCEIHLVTENDKYSYTLFNDAAIYEVDNQENVLSTASISGAQYERIEGGETPEIDDDVWAYKSGNMTGMLRGDAKFKYTNKIVATAPLYYSMSCYIAQQGRSQIEILKRPMIEYEYRCNQIVYLSEEHKFFD